MWPRAYANDSARVFARRAAEVEGEYTVGADPPVIVPIEDLMRAWVHVEDPGPLIAKTASPPTGGRWVTRVTRWRSSVRAFTPRKVVGVGSVGTRCYIFCCLLAAAEMTRCSCR